MVRIILLLAMAVMSLSAPAMAADITTVYIVRHADRDGDHDRLAFPAGFERAIELARMLMEKGGVAAAFVTKTTRAMQTAAPTVSAAGLDGSQTYDDAADLKARLGDYAGKSVLVVGHSNTVHDIGAALGVDGIPDTVSWFDGLFVVRLEGGKATLEVERYGVTTD